MYKSLQAGRAVAAILVVLFHLGGTMALAKYFGLPALAVPFSFGDAGVEFFFVLSGFIILTAHRQDIGRPERLTAYLAKRITRIYPAYWLIFLGVYALAMSSSALRGSVPHDLLLVLKSLLLLPQDRTVVGGTGAPVIVVAWTLQYEVLFYAFFAVMILSRTAAWLLGFAWLSLYVAHALGHAPGFPASFLAKDYLWLFVMGMAVARLAAAPAGGRPLAYVAGGALLFATVALDTVLGSHLLLGQRVPLFGLASALMILGLVRAEAGGRVIGGHRWLQLLGDASYALYLIHFPMISILCKLAVALHMNQLGVMGALVSYLMILAGCLGGAVAFHLWIERPVTAYVRTRLTAARPVPA